MDKQLFQFIIICCKLELTTKDLDYIHNFFNTAYKPKLIIYYTLQYGVLPIVYKTLKDMDNIPNDLLQNMKQHYLRIAQKNMLMSAELIRIVKLLQENDIPVIAFKGPTLAQLVYNDITLRQYGDIDILIHKKDFAYISNILISKGFEPLYPIDTFIDTKVMFDMNNDCPFYDTKRNISIEVHWDFFRKLALKTKLFKPWENIKTIAINNSTLYTLQNEAYLVYHNLHASKHIWERLEWIVDIDRFIRSHPTLDWDMMINMAKQLGASKMFLLGIYLSKYYFDTPIPQHINDLCKKANLHNISIFIEKEFQQKYISPEDSLTKIIKVIQLKDTIYHKMLTILEFIFKPGINERRIIILSNKYFWLYWIIRPISMIYRVIKCRIFYIC